MRSSTEVIELRDQKLLLPLEVLKTELGFASLYFGLLLGIKASEMLDNPWLLGVWVSFLLGTLLVDLFRDQSPRVLGPGLLGGLSWNLSQSGGRLRLLGATLITLGLTLLLIYSSEAFFSKVELLFRVIYSAEGLTNWILLSVVLVGTNLLGALAALRTTETARYARLFPLLALGLIYLKGVI